MADARDPPVRVDGVWKSFSRGRPHDSLRDLVPSLMRRLARRGPGGEANPDGLPGDRFWALRDVSFDVARGEALGIIGRNGAGKSTMLKLLTRLLRAERGRIALDGRVSALIEVGAGFHSDLSGRENIYLHGAILGMRRREIARKFDAIVAFAGVGEFLDLPVKRFSTGMNARLGFSVAAHLDPEILLVDEVLSVGDMAFQEKCVERMNAFKRQGVTILFVSHNLQAVASLCDRAVWLDGAVRAEGPAREVLEKYVSPSENRRLPDQGAEVRILSAELRDGGGAPHGEATPGEAMTLRVRYAVRAPLADLTLGFAVYRSLDNLTVYDGHVAGEGVGFADLAAGDELTVDFHFRCHLTRGQYHLACGVLHNPTRRHLARLVPAAMLTVHDPRSWDGVADLALRPALVERGRAPSESGAAQASGSGER